MDVEAQQRLHQTIHKVSTDTQALKYNTAIAALMGHLNHLEAWKTLAREEVRALVLMLAPFVPHITEELWCRLGEPYSVHQQLFPQADLGQMPSEQVTIAFEDCLAKSRFPRSSRFFSKLLKILILL